MDEVKDIFESLRSRIKNPFFGYAFLFSVFINWKVWFYLLFADISVLERYKYFDAETTTATLIYYPLGFALVSAILSPWLRLIFIWIAKYPTIQINLLQVSSESAIIEEKNRLGKIRADSQAIEEENIISRAERDAKVKGIEDEESRKAVQKEIEHSRISATLRKNSNGNGYRFYISNNGSTIVNNVNFKLLLDNTKLSPLTSDYQEIFPIKELHPGDEVSVIAAITLGMGPKFDSSLTWMDSSGVEHKKLSTITF